MGYTQSGGDEIAIAVLIEDGGDSSYSATSVAGRVFSAWAEM